MCLAGFNATKWKGGAGRKCSDKTTSQRVFTQTHSIPNYYFLRYPISLTLIPKHVFCTVTYYVGCRNNYKTSHTYPFVSCGTLGKVVNVSGKITLSLGIPRSTFWYTRFLIELPPTHHEMADITGGDSSPNTATTVLCCCGQFISPTSPPPKLSPEGDGSFIVKQDDWIKKRVTK